MAVINPGLNKRDRQLITIELRIVARPWHCADVDQVLNGVDLEEPQKSSMDRVEWPMVKKFDVRIYVPGPICLTPFEFMLIHTSVA